mgnify:CR=1 FL=1
MNNNLEPLQKPTRSRRKTTYKGAAVKVTSGILPRTDKQKELIHGYYASTSYADALVGNLLKTLDSLRLSENTIIHPIFLDYLK